MFLVAAEKGAAMVRNCAGVRLHGGCGIVRRVMLLTFDPDRLRVVKGEEFRGFSETIKFLLS